jgi:hypothetical protein
VYTGIYVFHIFLECGENKCRTNIGMGTGKVKPSWHKSRHQHARKIAFFSLWDILDFPVQIITAHAAVQFIDKCGYWGHILPPPKKIYVAMKRKPRETTFSRSIRNKLIWTTVHKTRYTSYCVNFVLKMNDVMLALNGKLFVACC